MEHVRKDGLLIVHFDADPSGTILVVQPYEVDPISSKKAYEAREALAPKTITQRSHRPNLNAARNQRSSHTSTCCPPIRMGRLDKRRASFAGSFQRKSRAGRFREMGRSSHRNPSDSRYAVIVDDGGLTRWVRVSPIRARPSMRR